MEFFSDLFRENNWKPLLYKDKIVIRTDKFPVNNGDILVASIESANNEKRQGICIDITGYCEMNGEVFKQGKGVRAIFFGKILLQKKSSIFLLDPTAS